MFLRKKIKGKIVSYVNVREMQMDYDKYVEKYDFEYDKTCIHDRVGLQRALYYVYYDLIVQYEINHKKVEKTFKILCSEKLYKKNDEIIILYNNLTHEVENLD